MWSAIMAFCAMISLFMALWILDSSSDNAWFGSVIVRGILTSAFGLLVLLFIWSAIEIQFVRKDDNDENPDFLSDKFRKVSRRIRSRNRPSPPRRYIKRKRS